MNEFEFGIFPIYYYPDNDPEKDEVAIPRLPCDPDTAAKILGTLAELLIQCNILTPRETRDTIRKAGGIQPKLMKLKRRTES